MSEGAIFCQRCDLFHQYVVYHLVNAGDEKSPR